MKPRPTRSWISELLDRDVVLAPRQSPDEIPAARKFWNLRHLNQDLPQLAAFHERVLLRTRGNTDLTTEVYVPHGKGPFPTMLYMHGGSWCHWSPAHVRKMVMRFAASGYVVFNLDYGLAPEHPFPWAVQDVVHAARWLTRNAGRYGGRQDNLVLAGDSAGAVPEYNFSLPAVLKNALEWLSRSPNPPANGKPCAVFGASVSPLGTARGHFHFRHVAVSLNMILVNVPHVDINSAKTKFDDRSTLTDQPALDSLRQLLDELKTLTLQLSASKPG
jgi:hypothetical protein